MFQIKCEDETGEDELFDEALGPRMVLYNESLVVGEQRLAHKVLLDAMSQAIEGIKIWSAKRLEERGDDVKRFALCVGSTLVAIEVAGLLKFATESTEATEKGLLDIALNKGKNDGLSLDCLRLATERENEILGSNNEASGTAKVTTNSDRSTSLFVSF